MLCLFAAIFVVGATADGQNQGQPDPAYDQSAKSSRIAAPFSWTGFYIGGNLGWNWGGYDVGASSETLVMPLLLQTPNPRAISRPVTVSVPGFDFDDGQFLGGGQLGYNQQFGKFVVGFEGDFDGTSLSGSAMFEKLGFVPPTDIGFFTIQRSIKTDWMASARIRAGFVWERFLFYGTGGAAFADVNVHAADSFTVPTVFQSASDDATMVGWTAGAGVEWALMKALGLGIEYRHSDFGSKSFDLATTGSTLSAQSTSVDLTDDQVTFRVNLHFNGLFGR